MKVRNIYFLFLIIFSISSFEGKAQNTDSLMMLGRNLLEKGSIYFDQGSLIEAEQKFQQILIIEDGNDYLANYFLAYTDYRLAVYYLEDKEYDKFDNYIIACEEELKSILDSNSTDSEAMALLASAYGEQIRKNNKLGINLVNKALRLMDDAIKNDPDNPRVQFLTGKLLLTIPESLGGDKNKSLMYLKRAVKLFEEQKETEDIDWGYIYALTWLGINYSKINDYENAINVYNKVLEIYPDFVWINNILLPEASNKLQEKENKEANN